MDGRCISQNELAQRWQISEATLERWRSLRKGPQFLRMGGQVRYRLVDVESYERESLEVFGTGQNNSKALISPVRTDKKQFEKSTAYHLKVRAGEGS
jgi:predicted DNA-binding transcriptional regulator AlpA